MGHLYDWALSQDPIWSLFKVSFCTFPAYRADVNTLKSLYLNISSEYDFRHLQADTRKKIAVAFESYFRFD